MELAISIPTVSLPGIGARMLIRWARVARAMSRSRLVILSTRTPLSGYTSKRVIVGPRVMSPALARMPKCASVSIMTPWTARNSS